MREVKFYKTESGKCPVEDFLEALTSKQSQKVTWVLQLIEELPSVPSQYLKKLVNTDDIWEVRIVVGTDIFRLLGFFDGSNLIVLRLQVDLMAILVRKTHDLAFNTGAVARAH